MSPIREIDHLCVRVDPFDAASTSDFLRAHGVEPGEVASRYGAGGEGPSTYLHDPEGDLVEPTGPPRAG